RRNSRLPGTAGSRRQRGIALAGSDALASSALPEGHWLVIISVPRLLYRVPEAHRCWCAAWTSNPVGRRESRVRWVRFPHASAQNIHLNPTGGAMKRGVMVVLLSAFLLIPAGGLFAQGGKGVDGTVWKQLDANN